MITRCRSSKFHKVLVSSGRCMSAAIWHAVPEKTSSRVFLVRHPIPFVILFDRRRLEPMILFQLTGILHLQTATGGRSALCVYEKERKERSDRFLYVRRLELWKYMLWVQAGKIAAVCPRGRTSATLIGSGVAQVRSRPQWRKTEEERERKRKSSIVKAVRKLFQTVLLHAGMQVGRGKLQHKVRKEGVQT